MLGKIEGKKRAAEDEMVGRHHQLNGHESEQTPGDGEGQESLACCNPWDCKELDTTQLLNNNNNEIIYCIYSIALKACEIHFGPSNSCINTNSFSNLKIIKNYL